MQSIENKVISRIYGRKRGWVFTPNDFLDLGSRAIIDKALSNLAQRGTVRRLTRGLYDYPRLHPKLGILPPFPEQVAAAIAAKDQSKFQPSGAYAANLLGLTEQVPAKIVFLTDGMNRTVTIGKTKITFKKTTPKNMATSGRITGLVIQAIRYLGKAHVNQQTIDQLRSRLSNTDKMQLLKDIRYAPAWIGSIIRHIAEPKD
ncbi:MAG: hypothetical protein FJ146_12480 [Deltaproteobacteria bacterium]|nr:hypothetical protein [Deltaproteobacteria bacterium]